MLIGNEQLILGKKKFRCAKCGETLEARERQTKTSDKNLHKSSYSFPINMKFLTLLSWCLRHILKKFLLNRMKTVGSAAIQILSLAVAPAKRSISYREHLKSRVTEKFLRKSVNLSLNIKFESMYHSNFT
jgi:hypothetical protein